jgi:DNA-binding MarR family transcriptional regulator
MPAGPPQLSFDPIEEARRQWVQHGWEDAADGMVMVTSLMRAHQIVLARVDSVLKPFGLTFARFELLMLLNLSSSGALPLNKIGSRLQVHPTSVTSAVDRLEAQELVKRVPHATDRRATLAQITEEGRRLVLKAVAELNAQVFGDPGVAPRQIQALTAVVTELRHSAGDF